MKIIVEGGNYGSGKSLDADVVLNGSNNPNPAVSGQTTTLQDRSRPPLLPRPPSALTTASILKFRGKHSP